MERDAATERQAHPSVSPKRGSRDAIRLGAVVALAVAAGLVAWVLIDDGDDEAAAPATTVPAATPALPATPSETVSRPTLVTVGELRADAAASSGPIYWAGARPGTRLELSKTSGGTFFLRYLPSGTAAGDLQPHLTVATYARANGFEEVESAAKNDGSTSLELDGGGLAVYDAKAPTNVHVAYPGEPYQVEVYSPEKGVALQLVTTGKVRRVPPAP
jgi:hypothetical protein